MNCEKGHTVTRAGIWTEAIKWAITHPGESKDFKVTANWCSCFMNRKKFYVDGQDKNCTETPCRPCDYPQCKIGNMNETPGFFDMVRYKTIDSKVKTILIKCAGQEKTSFTVVLSCLADGTKLIPMGIFKSKMMSKIKFPSCVLPA